MREWLSQALGEDDVCDEGDDASSADLLSCLSDDRLGRLRQLLKAGHGRVRLRSFLRDECGVSVSQWAVRNFIRAESAAAVVRSVDDLAPFASELFKLMTGEKPLGFKSASRYLLDEHGVVCSSEIMRNFERGLVSKEKQRMAVLEYWRRVCDEMFMPKYCTEMRRCTRDVPASVLESDFLFWISF